MRFAADAFRRQLDAGLFSQMFAVFDVGVGHACGYATKNGLGARLGLVGADSHDIEAGSKAAEFVGKVIEWIDPAAGRATAQDLPRRAYSDQACLPEVMICSQMHFLFDMRNCFPRQVRRGVSRGKARSASYRGRSSDLTGRSDMANGD